MLRKLAYHLLILVVCFVSGTACRTADKAADRPLSAATVIAPTAAPLEVVSDSGGLGPVQPPETFTPAPTITPAPTVTLAPLPPTPLTLSGRFGTDRNRLTGELATDPTLLQRRPMAVKISNAPARWTRPQSGLGQADLVFEHVTEGSITRFTAIFYGQTPAKVGPIRSARLIDLELPVMYDAALASSGSSIGVSRKLFSSDFSERILRTYVAGYYRTGEDKPYEHTLYARPVELWDALQSRGQNQAPQYDAVMAFGETVPPGGSVAEQLTLRYLKFTTIEWRYDLETGRYYRWVDGVEHVDANTGEQISAANVVVLTVPHRLDRTICEYQADDRCLAYSMEVQLWGEGRALALRNGRAYEVNWTRQQREEFLTLLDANRRPFQMQIGNTWFQVMPADYDDAFSIDAVQ